MESLYLLVPLVLLIIGIAIKVLFWAINSGQYDNLDSEGHRILFDDAAKKDLSKELSKDLSKDLAKKETPKNQNNNLTHSDQKDSTPLP